MSAFIVSRRHIDALVHAGIRSGRQFTLAWYVGKRQGEDYEMGAPWGPTQVENATARRRDLTRETADRVGAMLWNENKRSVDHRYNEANDREVYRFKESKYSDPVAILKAIDCYEYQSCEHPEWESSEAFAFCQALRSAMIHRLPGYEQAPWEIEETK